jgi:hypothetical protein
MCYRASVASVVLCAAGAGSLPAIDHPDGAGAMKANKKADAEGEVRGIVILQGNPAPVEPRLSFYMWCDISDAESDSTTKAA